MNVPSYDAQIRETFMEMAANYAVKTKLWEDCETHMLSRADAEEYDSQEWVKKSDTLFRLLGFCNMRDQELSLRCQRLRDQRDLEKEQAAPAEPKPPTYD